MFLLMSSGLKGQNLCQLLTVCYIWVVVLSFRVESLIRTSSGSATRLMKPMPDMDNNNPEEDAFFRPKSYTVNDFHSLVEGMQAERKVVDEQIARNVSDMLQRMIELEAHQKVSSSDYAAASWTYQVMHPWMCYYASLTGMFVATLSVVILLISFIYYCCQKVCHVVRPEKTPSMNSQQKLLSNI